VNDNRPQDLVFNGFRVVALNASRVIGSILITACLCSCGSSSKSISSTSSKAISSIHKPGLVCDSAERYKNQVVGDGHCVSLINDCTGAPFTSEWRPGAPVLNSKLPAGTVIATFKNGRYPSKSGHHAAIYIEQDHQGIWVWDQWRGKPVHKRLIRVRNDKARPGNTAQDYKVVLIK